MDRPDTATSRGGGIGAVYFLFTYVAKMGFLDGGPGFHHAAYKAWYFRTIRRLIREQARQS